MGVKCKVIGMERTENLWSNMKIEQCFVYIINACIVHGNFIEKIMVEHDNEKVRILIKGKKLRNITILKDIENINENKMLAALAYLCKECNIEASGINSNYKTNFNFININKGNIDIQSNSTERKIDDITSISIVILEKDIHETSLKKIQKMKRKIIFSIKASYRDIINNGTNVNLFGIKCDKLKIDGILVNEGDKEINETTSVEIYRMASEKKGFDVLVNGIIIKDPNLKDIIPWSKKPFKVNGYTSKRMYILLKMNRKKIDINNIEELNKKIEILYDDIERKVKKHKREFLNNKINICLEYDRSRMDHILYKLKRTSATKVTEEILDDYYQRLEGR